MNNSHAYEYDANGNLIYVNTSRTKKDGMADEKPNSTQTTLYPITTRIKRFTDINSIGKVLLIRKISKNLLPTTPRRTTP